MRKLCAAILEETWFLKRLSRVPQRGARPLVATKNFPLSRIIKGAKPISIWRWKFAAFRALRARKAGPWESRNQNMAKIRATS